MRKTRLGALVTMLVIVLAATGLAAPAFEKALPPDTVILVTARSIPALIEKVKTSALYDIWTEPSVKQFLDKPLQHLKEKIQEAEGEAGVTLEEVQTLFKGQVALAVSFGANFETPEVLVLVDIGDEGERTLQLIETIQSRVAEEAGEEAPTKIEEEFEGAKLFHVQDEPEAEGENAAPEKPVLTYGVAGDVFLMGTPVEAVKRTVGFLKTPPATGLNQAPEYTSTLNKVSADADVVAFVNIKRIVTLAGQQTAGPVPIAGLLDMLGIANLVSLGMGVEIDEQYATSRIFVQNTGEPKGIVRLLMPTPGPLYTGTEAPADCSGYMAARVEPTKLWDDIEKGLAMMQPEALAMLNNQMNTFAEQLGEPFDLRNDILSVFGPRVSLYTRHVKPFVYPDAQAPAFSMPQQIVLMVELSSKEAFEGLLSKVQRINPMMASMMTERDYMGYKVYDFGPPTPPGAVPAAQEGGATATPKPALAVMNKQLVFSSHVSALEAHLRRNGKDTPAVAGRPEFQAGLQRLPQDGRVLVSFQDATNQVEYLIGFLQSPQFQASLDNLRADPDTAEVVDLFDFSLVPPPGDITKHLVPTTGCAVVDADGLLVISQSPLRKAAK